MSIEYLSWSALVEVVYPLLRLHRLSLEDLVAIAGRLCAFLAVVHALHTSFRRGSRRTIVPGLDVRDHEKRKVWYRPSGIEYGPGATLYVE